MELIGEDGSLDLSRTRPVGEVLNGYSYFADGDVLFAKVTPCFENGKAAVVLNLPSGHGFGTTEVTTLRPSPRLEQRFLGYLVRSDRFRQLGIASMTGAGGLKRVPNEYVRDFMIALPPVAEQRTIAQFLDCETARIDRLIAKQEQLIATLREDRIATITHAVTEGLDPAVDFKPVDSDLPMIPAHWSVKPLKHLGTLITGGTPPSGELGYYTSDSETGFPWLRPDDLDPSGRPSEASRYLSETGKMMVPHLLPPSVHVVSIGATLAKVGYVAIECSSNQQITAMVNAECPKFVFFALVASHDRIWASSMGNTLPIISASRLGAVKVAVPPIEEQTGIVRFLDDRCARIDALIAKAGQVIQILSEYRSALITDAVTGKIDVREAVA
ncbi:Type I restriction-modification system, specificity subunit S [Mycobacterium marinum MB2]|nr:Type I restriction-modification system, specificity subunit S [Mycobacterium marinum MB2]